MAAPEKNPGDLLTFVFDVKLCRPGCALIQALGAVDPHGEFGMLFDNHVWLLAPTPDMQRLTATRAQWESLAAKVNKLKGDRR